MLTLCCFISHGSSVYLECWEFMSWVFLHIWRHCFTLVLSDQLPWLIKFRDQFESVSIYQNNVTCLPQHLWSPPPCILGQIYSSRHVFPLIELTLSLIIKRLIIILTLIPLLHPWTDFATSHYCSFPPTPSAVYILGIWKLDSREKLPSWYQLDFSML